MAMASALFPSGRRANWAAVIVVTWLVLVTSIAGTALAVTTTPLNACGLADVPVVPDELAKLTVAVPEAAGLTFARDCTGLPSRNKVTV